MCIIRQVTLFSMMPYVSLWICVIMSGIWSDQLRARGVIGTTLTRKIFHFIGKPNVDLKMKGEV
jgi:hypothetical protein